MKRWLFANRGFLASYRMCPKNNGVTRSAAEQQELGWPLPAAVVASMESMRNWLAMPDKVSSIVIFIFVPCNCMASRTKEKEEKKPLKLFWPGTFCAFPEVSQIAGKWVGKVYKPVGPCHQYW